MPIYKLADAVSSAATQTAQGIPSAGFGRVGLVQAIFTGTGEIALQGSLDGTNWVQLGDNTFIFNEMRSVVLCPFMRADVASISGGTATLILHD